MKAVLENKEGIGEELLTRAQADILYGKHLDYSKIDSFTQTDTDEIVFENIGKYHFQVGRDLEGVFCVKAFLNDEVIAVQKKYFESLSPFGMEESVQRALSRIWKIFQKFHKTNPHIIGSIGCFDDSEALESKVAVKDSLMDDEVSEEPFHCLRDDEIKAIVSLHRTKINRRLFFADRDPQAVISSIKIKVGDSFFRYKLITGSDNLREGFTSVSAGFIESPCIAASGRVKDDIYYSMGRESRVCFGQELRQVQQNVNRIVRELKERRE